MRIGTQPFSAVSSADILAKLAASPGLTGSGKLVRENAPTLTPGANAAALTASGYSLTGANAQSLIDLAGTWNTSGTPTALKLGITDTASNAASLLIDLQVGGASKFKVAKDGTGTLAGGLLLGGDLALPGIGFAVNWPGLGSFSYVADGIARIRNAAGTSFGQLVLGLTNSGAPSFLRDGAGIRFVAGDATTGIFLAGVEQAAPAAPAANGYRIFAQDNGGGKTQLMVIFSTGAAQQLAIEP